MATSKVIFNGTILMDVTEDTVDTTNLFSGETATKNDGTSIVGAYVAPTFSTQTKSVTPTETAQTITPDGGYDGLSSVSVAAIPSQYIVPTGIVSINQNGVVDVSSYASASVNVAGASTYSVSASLSNVTSTNNDEEVLAGGSFFMDLTPAAGLAINSVTVLMGGSDITSQVFTPGVGAKTINANGSYDASLEYLDGWSTVTVSVPNSYSASDEGKVVSDGALVSQTSASYTSNGTYDTTTVNSVVVNVSGGSYPTWTGGSY